MKQNLIIFGKGDFAHLAYLKFLESGLYNIVSFTVNKEYIDGPEFCGLPLIDFDYLQDYYPPTECSLFLAIGYRNVSRSTIFELTNKRAGKWFEAKSKGYNLISYISPKATVDRNTTKIGENCFISDNVTIEPFAMIGDNVTIWGGGFIAHHTTVGSHCFIAPRAAIAGRVTIGESCFLGVNSTIRDNVKIGKQCVIGAGAVILKDTQEGGVYKAQETLLSAKE